MKARAFMRVLALLLLATGAIGPACAGTTDNPYKPAVLVKGFGVSPKGFPIDYSQLPAFYTEVAGMAGGGVLWNGAWRDDVAGGTDAGTIPEAAAVNLVSSTTFGFMPVVVFGWRSGATLYLNVPPNHTNNWTNAEAKDRFRSMLATFAATYQPPFVFLGNENDFYYEQNPVDYANWIAFYNAAYDILKATSPTTLVGPVFNYEHMAGTGLLNGWTTAYWPALEMHDLTRIDIVGITLYPWLNFATADSVPANYLDPLLARIGSKPIAITETGWPAENLAGLNPPWETTESAQVTYLARLSTMLSGKPVRIVNYLFLHAMQDPGGSPFEWKLAGSISVRDALGNPRAVYDSWLAFPVLPKSRRRAVRH